VTFPSLEECRVELEGLASYFERNEEYEVALEVRLVGILYREKIRMLEKQVACLQQRAGE
jgi:hypothetical protein